MKPQPNQQIHVVFRNGIQLDGTVIDWSDDKSVLTSTSGAATIVILKTDADVLFYRVSNAKTEYQEVKEKPVKTDEDIRDLAELKNELNILEREEIREKLNSHEISGTPQVNYGSIIPKIASTPNNPNTQSRRQDTNPRQELQSLFAKKD